MHESLSVDLISVAGIELPLAELKTDGRDEVTIAVWLFNDDAKKINWHDNYRQLFPLLYDARQEIEVKHPTLAALNMQRLVLTQLDFPTRSGDLFKGRVVGRCLSRNPIA